MQQRRQSSLNPIRDRKFDCSPELDLLLVCARWPQRQQEDRELIRKLATRQLDWQLFLRLVHHHRILPLVSHNLLASAITNPTPELEAVIGELCRRATSSAREALGSLAELRRVVQKLEAHGIHARVLKGLPLAQSVFGDLSLRSPGDIDLLIGEAAIVETDQVLRSYGYRSCFAVERLSPRRFSFYRSHWKDLLYYNPATGFEVDLHWRCFRNTAMPGARLGNTTGPEAVAFGRFKVETLPRMEGLLYLCIHGMLDGWLYLKTLVDVAAQVRTMSEAELSSLAKLAAGYDMLPELTATLTLVRRYLAIDHWSERLLPSSDKTVQHILRYADLVLVEGGFLAERDEIPISTTLAFELGLRRNFRYRFELLLRVLFRPRMWETIPLPDWLFGIYPLLSPLEWAIHRLRRWWTKAASSGTVRI